MIDVFVIAPLTDLATGLGVLPFAFFKRATDRLPGVTTGLSAMLGFTAALDL